MLRRVTAIAALGSLALWPVTARAQRRATGGDEAAAGEAPGGESGGVTVRAEAARRAASDQTYNAQEFRAVPRTSAAEFLTLAPGFFLSQHGGEGKAHQFFLRGFNAEHGQDVEFNVGGVPVNEVSNVHGQGYADLNFMIPEVVDRVRVIEGPYDPRQGDFAVGGSSRFDLGVAPALRGIMVRGSYGMFNTARAVAVLAPREMSRETFLAAEIARSDGYGPPPVREGAPAPPTERAWSRAAAMGQYQLNLGASVSLRALASSYAGRWDSAGVVSERDLASGRQDFYGTNDPNQGGFSSRHSALVEATFRHTGGRTAVSVFATLRELRVRENFTGFVVDPMRRGDGYEQTYNATTVGLSGYHRRAFGPVIAEAGLYGRHDITTQAMRRLRYVDQLPYDTDVDADVAATNVAVYADVEIPRLFVPGLRLRGGVRVDALAYQIDDRLPRAGAMSAARGRRDAQGFHIGPRATLEYEVPRTGVTFVGAYGNGFRSPQALSLGDGENAPFAQVHSGDLGVRYRGRAGTVTVAGFATHVDRDLFFEPTLGTNVFIPGTEATTRLGVSAQVRVQPIREILVLASATYARATFDATGIAVPYVPALVGRLDATFHREFTRLRNGWPVIGDAGLGLSYVGYRALPFEEKADAVFLVDAGASARVGPFELGLSVRNATAAQWRDAQFNYASNFDATNTAPSRVPVRHFSAGRPFTLLATVTVYL